MVVFESKRCVERLYPHYLRNAVLDELFYRDTVLSPGKGKDDTYVTHLS